MSRIHVNDKDSSEVVCIKDFFFFKKDEIYLSCSTDYQSSQGVKFKFIYKKDNDKIVNHYLVNVNEFDKYFSENIEIKNMKKNICIFGSVHLKRAFIETMKEKGWKPSSETFWGKSLVNDYVCFHVDSKLFSTQNTSESYYTCTLPQDWDAALELIRKSKKSVSLQLGSDFSTFEINDDGFTYKDVKYGRQDVKNLQDLFDTLVSLNRRIGRNAESMTLTLALDVRSIHIGFGNQLSLNEIKRILEVYKSLNI